MLPSLTVAFLGDAKIGKSNLITTYTSNYYTGYYTPTVADIFFKTLSIIHHDGEPSTIQLIVSDLGGSEDYDRLRLLCLGQTPAEVFVLCFEAGDEKSALSVATKWKDIAGHMGKDVPIVVVGCKADEAWRGDGRDNSWISEVVGASAYLECSALKQRGVRKVFRTIIALGLTKREESAVGN